MKSFTSADVDVATGRFMLSVGEAYVIRSGLIDHAIKNAKATVLVATQCGESSPLETTRRLGVAPIFAKKAPKSFRWVSRCRLSS